MGKTSNHEVKMLTPENEFGLVLSEFIRYSDDSSIRFKLFCRSSYFEIRNFNFFSDFSSFKLFLNKIKNVYEILDGQAEIKTSYENDVIRLIGKSNGSIVINCEAYFNGGSESCIIEYVIDQTYLPGFIEDLQIVYNELGLIS
jgi:hypothetical protein